MRNLKKNRTSKIRKHLLKIKVDTIIIIINNNRNHTHAITHFTDTYTDI